MSDSASEHEEFRLDRSHVSVARLEDPDNSTAYWLTRPVEERLRALELLRKIFYGDAAATARLQRAFEVVRLERR